MPNISDSEWLAPMVIEAFNNGRIELGAALARLTVQAYRMEQAQPLPAAPAAPLYDELTTRTGDVRAVVPVPPMPDWQARFNGHTCAIGVPDPDHPLRTDAPHCAACVAKFGPAPTDQGCTECGTPHSSTDPCLKDICVNAYGSPVPWAHPSCAVIDHGHPHKEHPEAPAESDPAPAPADAVTTVTPSARCIVLVKGSECHGVLFWTSQIEGPPRWDHLNPADNHHTPFADRPNPS